MILGGPWRSSAGVAEIFLLRLQTISTTNRSRPLFLHLLTLSQDLLFGSIGLYKKYIVKSLSIDKKDPSIFKKYQKIAIAADSRGRKYAFFDKELACL